MDSTSPTEKRLFLGIPAPAGIIPPLRELQASLEGTSGIRWVKEENLHITVFFFGNVSEEIIPNLIEMIRITLKAFRPFELAFDQFYLAPKPSRPRMIRARYHKAETFRHLVNRITDLYEQISPEQQQRRSPTPHITVARLRGLRQLELPPDPVGTHHDVSLPRTTHHNVSIHVTNLILWSSDLQPSGAVYEPLARFSL